MEKILLKLIETRAEKNRVIKQQLYVNAVSLRDLEKQLEKNLHFEIFGDNPGNIEEYILNKYGVNMYEINTTVIRDFKIKQILK